LNTGFTKKVLKKAKSTVSRKGAFSGKFFWYLAAVLLLAAILRIPGIFWGYHFLGGPTKVALHTDEMSWVGMTNDFLKNKPRIGHWYPPSESFQVALLAAPLRKFFHVPFITVFYLGRFLSLFYGLLLIGLTGIMARQLSGRDETGILAAIFLTLSDTQATYSHIFIPDVAATFWFYLALFLLYLFYNSPHWRWLAFSALASGAALAAKFNNAALPVILGVTVFVKKSWKLSALAVVLVLISFYLMTGAKFSLLQAASSQRNLAARFTETNPAKLVDFFLTFLGLVVAAGLGVFVFFLAGLIVVIKKIFSRQWVGWPAFLIFGGGLCFYFLEIFSLSFTAFRFLVPFLPTVAILAAFSFQWFLVLEKNKKWLVPLVIIYQFFYLVPAQANFVFEPREAAGRWLRANFPAGTTLSVSAQAFVPPQYQTTFKMNLPVAVLAEQGYERYLTKNGLNYKITGQLPELKEIYNPNLEYGDDPLILQKITTGKTEYRLVKEFDTLTLTPEWAFWKWLGYHPSLLGKVLIYQKEKG
jgi:hypothetical protein